MPFGKNPLTYQSTLLNEENPNIYQNFFNQALVVGIFERKLYGFCSPK